MRLDAQVGYKIGDRYGQPENDPEGEGIWVANIDGAIAYAGALCQLLGVFIPALDQAYPGWTECALHFQGFDGPQG